MTGCARIVLIGLSGTGKTSVARLLAERLGWMAIDTDALIEQRFGQPIPEIFASHGEAHFREAERAILLDALTRRQVVIATGGGAVATDAVWADDTLGDPATLVVALDATPEELCRRLREQEAAAGAAAARPLLAGPDPRGRLIELKRQRQGWYDRADVTLVVDQLGAAEVADEIVGLLRLQAGEAKTLPLTTPSGASSIQIGPGAGERLDDLVRDRWPKARRAWLISDQQVGGLYGDAVAARLAAVGLDVRRHDVPVGEGSKSLAVAGRLYDWLLDGGVERGDLVIALGGGMVGDLAGFVAATCLRGLGLVQLPTSLLAMVDSSVGGKTGINHRAGKNLIGAFSQPPLVVIDPAFLGTLPARELRSSWAEIIKHAVIQPSTPGGERADLLGFLERNAAALLARRDPATSYLISRNVALKAAVVGADEREAGLRAILNFGHTLGHAIEAAGYQYLHGEAIAVGLRGALWLGEALGTADPNLATRVNALLDRFDLPRQAEADPARVLALLGSDKKRAAGKQRWILPAANGGVTIREDVPEALVREMVAVCLTARA